jgi:hypothetical protein
MNSRTIHRAYIAIAAIGVLYAAVRAVVVDITYDEAWSYIDYARPGKLHQILLPNVYGGGSNNHPLNSMLMSLAKELNDQNVWVLRVHSVLAFAGFTVLLRQFTRTFANPVVGVCAFGVLAFNPFLLDFASLARGYALALFFAFCGLHFLLRWYAERRAHNSYLAHIFFLLSSLSNYSFLAVLLSFATVLIGYQLYIFVRNNGGRLSAERLTEWAIPALTWPVLLYLYYLPIGKQFQDGGELWYGGHGTFVHAVLGTGFEGLRYVPQAILPTVHPTCLLLAYGFAAAFVALALAVLVRGLLLNVVPRPLVLVLLGTLVCATVVMVLQNEILGTLYPIGRTALLFWCVAVLGLFACIDAILTRRRLANAVAIGLMSVAAINFALKANFTHTFDWQFNAGGERLFNIIEQDIADRSPPHTLPVKVWCSSLLNTALEYYSMTNGRQPRHVERIQNPDQFQECGYYCLTVADAGELPGSVLRDTLLYLPVPDLYVFRKRE